MIDINKLQGKVIALVGGAGFIGHNLALELKDFGAEPHVIDSLQVNNLGAFANIANSKLYLELMQTLVNCL